MNDRISRILCDLERVRTELLALSDDIWLSIDHNDAKALESGIHFKRLYNEKMVAFDLLTAEFSSLIRQHSHNLQAGAIERVEENDNAHNERLVRELNREQPYTINDDFTYKRPHGFILDGQAITGVTTWRRLFEHVCQQLLRRDPERFLKLLESPDFVSRRGHPTFSRNPQVLRSAGLIGDGIHVEINLSANHICDIIRKLLVTFKIPENRLQLFLREDRDAKD